MDGFFDEMDIPEDDVVLIDKEMRFLWFYWCGCFGMFPVSVAIILIGGEGFSELILDDEQTIKLLTVMFLAVSIISIAVSVFLRKRFLSGGLRGFISMTLQQARADQPEWIGRFRAGKVICTVLSSTAGPMGFMLFLLSGEMWLFGLFMALGMGVVIYHRPRREELIEYYQRCHKTID